MTSLQGQAYERDLRENACDDYSTPDPVGFVHALLFADPNIDQAFKAVFGGCTFIDRRVINDRRQQEFLTEVDRRRDEFRYGRRGTDMAPDPLDNQEPQSAEEIAEAAHRKSIEDQMERDDIAEGERSRDPLEQSRYELRQEKARDERDGQDRYGV